MPFYLSQQIMNNDCGENNCAVMKDEEKVIKLEEDENEQLIMKAFVVDDLIRAEISHPVFKFVLSLFLS